MRISNTITLEGNLDDIREFVEWNATDPFSEPKDVGPDGDGVFSSDCAVTTLDLPIMDSALLKWSREFPRIQFTRSYETENGGVKVTGYAHASGGTVRESEIHREEARPENGEEYADWIIRTVLENRGNPWIN